MAKTTATPVAAPTLPRAGLLRRFAAIFYDALLLIAVWMGAAALVLAFTGGAVSPGNPLFQTYLLLVTFAFFAWFWMHGGQTLGMRAWRVRLRRRDGGPLTLYHVLLRFMVAIGSWLALGLGFLWALVDKEGLTWHDRYSETELVVEPRSP
ncbi:RDD family protein [Ectothiorhodospiraceae bacterium 2226]|nr:RDD family protein [Ectothiorhodospiraceae bacterium 2226]